MYRVHQNRPFTVWSGGLLSMRETAKLGWGAQAALQKSRHLAAADYGSFAALDDEEAWAWSSRTMGESATAAFFAPCVHGFYFHPLRGSSRALLQALLGFRSSQTLAVPGGWDALPRSMAQDLTVHVGVEVSSVRELGDGVQVDAHGEALHADAAILAVPAPQALAMLEAPTPQERRLLETRYAAAIHIALGFRPDWRLPDDLKGLHGLLWGAPSPVAAMVVEQGRLPAAGPEVLTVMLGDVAAREWMDRDDTAVVNEVLAWLRTRWPDLPAGLVASQVHRWPLAEPLSPPGRARAVLHYREATAPTRRVLLCGDYTGLPWTDGAAHSGQWAADRLKERLA
jgi:oxygen-dependent protoporphyrinogen oxidase